MNADILRGRISSLASHILFSYKGTSCGVDPINHHQFEMWYGDSAKTSVSIDDVMTSPFFDGKSLSDIADKITNIEL